MNTHEHLSIEILADYAEGLLGDADATSVAEHLASCADCQAEAELLVSVRTILAADDPGPMPAHYATRIDAALAELAAAEPVTPKRRDAAAAGQGAAVIDLASRRRFTPAARVTSVAASLVLLIGGVALGMQALETNDPGNPNPLGATGLQPSPLDDSAAAAFRASLYAQVEKPTGAALKKGKNGAVIDKTTGTVFIKNKVLFPDGTVVVHRKSGIAEVRTFNATTGEVRVDQVARPTKAAPTSTPGATVAATPEVAPERTPQPTPASKPETPPTDVGDPYVTNSGDVYNPDNFATKVQALLRESGDVVDTPAGNAPTGTDQNRVSAGAVRSEDSATGLRGPAPAEVAAKVKRCASQLRLSGVLAGDAGVWRGEAATIVVTRNGPDAKQAVGYVVYGDCTKEAPATPASVQWEQRVDLPGKDEVPAPAPTAPPAPQGNGDTVNDTVTSRATNSVANSREQ